jgi:hypothetical protein
MASRPACQRAFGCSAIDVVAWLHLPACRRLWAPQRLRLAQEALVLLKELLTGGNEDTRECRGFGAGGRGVWGSQVRVRGLVWVGGLRAAVRLGAGVCESSRLRWAV